MPKPFGPFLVSPKPQFLVKGNPIGSVCFVIEPEREPFGLIPPLDPNSVKEHGPTRLYSASEATASVSCLNRLQSTCTNGVVWSCSSGAFSANIVRYSPKCAEEEFCELRRYGVLRSSPACGLAVPGCFLIALPYAPSKCSLSGGAR